MNGHSSGSGNLCEWSTLIAMTNSDEATGREIVGIMEMKGVQRELLRYYMKFLHSNMNLIGCKGGTSFGDMLSVLSENY